MLLADLMNAAIIYRPMESWQYQTLDRRDNFCLGIMRHS